MVATLPLLLEIGTEELPSSFVDGALAALPALVAGELSKIRLSHGDVRALGTPRRLAVIVQGVATEQSDLDQEVVGPPEAAAFKNGQPTKAAEAFAAKLGVQVASLTIVEREAGPKQKAGRYIVGRQREAGRPAAELLPAALASVCANIPFRKSMRWASLDTPFGRPVQWLVAILGDRLVPCTFAGVASGRSSRGHRFLAPATFEVRGAGDYVDALRSRHVLVDREERVATMMGRVDAAAKAAGGTYDPEPMLVSENASLVEEPHVVTGSFDSAFLELPAAVIRAVARGHQRYFCVERPGAQDELVPKYLAVVNTANRPDLIRQGTDRVMRARLSDAKFFWAEDQKIPLGARYDKLQGIVFHNRLGTVQDKVLRIERLAGHVAAILALDETKTAQVARAARLCKCDLVALMVGEFPELQGHMGRAYALRQGESADVADAIRDHYKPVGAQDDVAGSDVSAAVALADRMDTLVGCFAVGLAPSGTNDPFALRRACIGALRTLLDRGYGALSFVDLAGLAYDGYAGAKLDLSKSETLAKVEDFAIERLRGLLASATSMPVAEAVLASGFGEALARSVTTLARARALQAVVDAKEPWLEKAKVVAKRLAGISRQAKPVLHAASEFKGSAKGDDAVLQELVGSLNSLAQGLGTEQAMRAALVAMGPFATDLDRIFVETLVNDPNDTLTPIRLETLAHGARSMLRIADFSRLA
jgi:glycyl-tRNA synthetase beta chain